MIITLSRLGGSWLIVLTALFLSGCTDETVSTGVEGTYSATIVRTEHGVPHISARDWGSLGFGEAYAAAEDHLCNMAWALLQAQGQSATHFGAGHENDNIARDIVVKALQIPAAGKRALAQQPPDIRSWIEGYTAGYNQYLADHSANQAGAWCAGEPWVTPVQADAFMAQYVMLVHSLPRVAKAVIGARLPGSKRVASAAIATSERAPEPSDSSLLLPDLAGLQLDGLGSNAWALAAKRSENGRGLLLANPHYPWYGIARFWEKHLTIPGVMDAYGAGLIGTPGVAIGFNANVGWSHTVSDSKRTVLYQLALNPDNPQQYQWQDNWRDLKAVEVTVDVKTKNGLTPRSHVVWFSHHGPLIAVPGLSQDPYAVFAVRDANADNIHTLAQWQAMAMAADMDAFIDAHRVHNAMPWVNTIAASADGRAVYLDNSTVGALSAETVSAWQARLEQMPPLKQLYLAKGLVVLDGSKERDEWRTTNAPIPFTEPFERRPLIESDHYVFNANDSYWLSDPAAPVSGYSPLYGATGSPRSVRTRMNIALLNPDSGYGYAGIDGKFSMTEVQAALFTNDSLTAALLVDELVSACQSARVRVLGEATIDIGESCEILAKWDRQFNLESRGAVLFREWLTRYDYTQTYLAPGLFAEPFDVANPAITPRGLENSELALDRLAEAQVLLREVGIALDSPLSTQQKVHRDDRVIAVHGGNRFEGVANLQVTGRHETPLFTADPRPIGDSATLTKSGYNITHGSSFIVTLGFDNDGPVAQALLSYSQSGNASSDYFADQTELYANKRWRDIRFHQRDIEAAAVSTVHVSGPRQVVGN